SSEYAFSMTLRLFLFMLCGLCAAMVAPRAGLAADSDERTILVVGDSLSAEYGLSRGSGWVALLGARLSERHPPVRMVNASVSGDTTSGGLSRLPEALARTQPGIVVIELGSNDALR